ncbi:yippee-domain-containing protein [Nemania diffusa]|nr:yippee-domain-containing protein [Nemania diffusa]
MLNEVALHPPPPLQVGSGSGSGSGGGGAAAAAALPPPKFPTYILPSLSRPFRRHRRISSSPGNAIPAHNGLPPSLSSSPADTELSNPANFSPASSSSPSWFSHIKHGLRSPSTGQSDVDGLALTRIQPDTIRCSTCGTDFAFYSQIVSKGFTGRYGRAWLVSPPEGSPQKSGPNLINIKVGKPENRLLVTGAHVVSDIQCTTCRARVGWKYVDAKEESQKYKIGKFILETQRTVEYGSWDDAVADDILELEFEQEKPHYGDNMEPIVFDSDDSDECEDLFAGVWDAKIAAKRRKLKLNRR